MNADLKNALEEVQAYFIEARINKNVVEFTSRELSTDDLINLSHVNRKNPKLCPWVFRSDKEVRVVFFLKDNHQNYIANTAMIKQGRRVKVECEKTFNGEVTLAEKTKLGKIDYYVKSEDNGWVYKVRVGMNGCTSIYELPTKKDK